ncbi:MFS transporter [candidate division KSB1 bacterium]|nr:MAG: MFS transporter [candidate division KSB1 bacterium]
MKNNRSIGMVVLIIVIFFVISLLTNIINAVLPQVKDSYSLTHGLAGLLPLAFFIAYGVMSIPSGMMIKKLNRKTMLVGPFILACLAALLFGFFPTFPVYLVSLFSIGAGMAMLQVVINPILRSAGGEEHFAANSVIAQLFFSGAGYVGPHIYSYLVTNLESQNFDKNILISLISRVTPEKLTWVSIYWVFAGITLLMAVVLSLLKIPKIELKSDEEVGALEVHKQLFKNKIVILYFIGIFAYVGSEQGLANWISEFLKNYHNVDPATTGASVVANFWLVFAIGCGLGVILLKIFNSRAILKVFTVLSIISLTISLFAPVGIAKYSFPAVGFFYSIMWSIIFSLALNSVPKEHGTFSGILCTGIIGGAIIPALIGWLADKFGLRAGMILLYLTLGYILSIGFWSKPLIKNKTIFDKE